MFQSLTIACPATLEGPKEIPSLRVGCLIVPPKGNTGYWIGGPGLSAFFHHVCHLRISVACGVQSEGACTNSDSIARWKAMGLKPILHLDHSILKGEKSSPTCTNYREFNFLSKVVHLEK